MGSLISEDLKIYALQTNSSCDLPKSIELINSLEKVSIEGHHKIIIPISKGESYKQFILTNHHKIVLLIDNFKVYEANAHEYSGIPVITQSQIEKNNKICEEVSFNNFYCPIPVVLERFHESYLINYFRTFKDYGIRALNYQTLQDYFKSSCKSRWLIGSSHELELLALKLKNANFKQNLFDQQRTYIKFYCFCKKQAYEVPKKIKEILQNLPIQIHYFDNLLDIIEKISLELLIKKEQKNSKEKMIFYLTQNEKDKQYLIKMPRKLQKMIRNFTITKVMSKRVLIDKVKKASCTTIVISKENKQMINYFKAFEELERYGLEDRFIIVKREEQINEKLIQKLQSTYNKPKFVKSYLYEKSLIFFGTIEHFKFVLENYINLNFKLFIDASTQRQKMKYFIDIESEVIISSVRVCSCMQEFRSVKAKVIMIETNLKQVKFVEKKEMKSKKCLGQRWFGDIGEIEKYLRQQQQKGNIITSIMLNYNFKKRNYLSRTLRQIFLKIRQKKMILKNEAKEDNVILFTTQNTVMNQISSLIVTYLTSKITAHYSQSFMLPKIKNQLYKELLELFQIDQFERQILRKIQKDQSQDVYALAFNLLELLVKYNLFYEKFCSCWKITLCKDRQDIAVNCPILIFLVLLGFNKGYYFSNFKNLLIQNSIVTAIHVKFSEKFLLEKIIKKTRSNFLYTADFILCQEVTEESSFDDTMIFKLEGSQLSCFNLFLPFIRIKNKILIPPLTKIQIDLSRSESFDFKLSLSTKQHFYFNFGNQFLLQSNNPLIKLISEERKVRTFDTFLESMEFNEFEAASYEWKLMIKENKIHKEVINAFYVLQLIRKNNIDAAKRQLKQGAFRIILDEFLKTKDNQQNKLAIVQSEVSSNIGNYDIDYQQISNSSLDRSSDDEEETVTSPNAKPQFLKTNNQIYWKNQAKKVFNRKHRFRASTENPKIIPNFSEQSSLLDTHSQEIDDDGLRIVVNPPSLSKGPSIKIEQEEQYKFTGQSFGQNIKIAKNHLRQEGMLNKIKQKYNLEQEEDQIVEQFGFLQQPTKMFRNSKEAKCSIFQDLQSSCQKQENKLEESTGTGKFFESLNYGDQKRMSSQIPRLQVFHKETEDKKYSEKTIENLSSEQSKDYNIDKIQNNNNQFQDFSQIIEEQVTENQSSLSKNLSEGKSQNLKGSIFRQIHLQNLQISNNNKKTIKLDFFKLFEKNKENNEILPLKQREEDQSSMQSSNDRQRRTKLYSFCQNTEIEAQKKNRIQKTSFFQKSMSPILPIVEQFKNKYNEQIVNASENRLSSVDSEVEIEMSSSSSIDKSEGEKIMPEELINQIYDFDE